MNTQNRKMLKNIGTKIRAERKRLGLSMDTLCKRVGISKMTLHRIETGTTSPSIITLSEISFQLKQPLESLIREGDAKVVLLKRNQQDTILDPESGIRVVAPKGLISDRITITHAELEEGVIVDTHTNKGFEWALFYEGEAVVKVRDKDFPVKGGDAIFFDAHFPHSIRVQEKIKYVGLFLHDG
ncbi:MAG: XRE family transcriptional regulator [Deltaproteobacteria bacterium]|nr:XRE family transcriptional regulator [Deltaproteobacteria bacterium]